MVRVLGEPQVRAVEQVTRLVSPDRRRSQAVKERRS
jgi:hypothetical protein